MYLMMFSIVLMSVEQDDKKCYAIVTACTLCNNSSRMRHTRYA